MRVNVRNLGCTPTIEDLAGRGFASLARRAITAPMRLRLTRRDRRFAAEIYRRYSAKEGSDNIASKAALTYLSALLGALRPRHVLEVGAGIGTITDALLSHDVGVERVTSVEHNQFCLDALSRNLSHHDSARLRIVTDEAGLDGIDPVDLIIGDGGRNRRAAWQRARPGVTILVEGNRAVFREQCRQALMARGLAIEFKEYGAGRGLKVWRFRGWLPLVKLANGCWIGTVSAPPDNAIG